MKKLLLLLVVFWAVASLATAQSRLGPKPVGKLSADLQQLAKSGKSPQQKSSNLGDESVPLEIVYDASGDKVLLNLVPSGTMAQLKSALLSKNYKITGAAGNLINAWVPISDLTSLESMSVLRFTRPAYAPMHNATIIGQGDVALKADIARSTYNVNGAGVKVGVLSDSYNILGGAAASILNDELPGVGNPNGFTTPVQVLEEYSDTDGTDEGRAMLEIIHDVAPASTLAFNSAFNGEAAFANGITALQVAGCKVIVDDVFYFAEPMFQDGIIAQSVNAAKAAGATYFSSAGNQANKSYENTANMGAVTLIQDGVTYNNLTGHNFGSSVKSGFLLPITFPAGVTYVILQWDQPFRSVSGGTGATTDLDLYILRAATSPAGSYTTSGSGADDNLANGDPVEVASISTAGGLRYLYIEKYAGPNPGKLKIIILSSTAVFSETVPGINASTSFGHNNAAGAIAVGAVRYDKTPAFGVNPPTIESFSSRGGTPILFNTAGVALGAPEIRNKPEISAPQGANTSFFGQDYEPDGKPNFFGTSAAAPYAAAVAALMLQAKPCLTPNNIKATMQNSCIDMDDPQTPGFDAGFDFRTGYGLLQADAAVGAVVSRISSNSPVCKGGTISLSAGGGTNYTWKGPQSFTSNAATPTIDNATNPKAGWYSVTIVNGACTTTARTSVVVTTQISINISVNTNPLCEGTTLNMTASGAESYSWTNSPAGFTSTSATPTIPSVSIVSIANMQLSNNGIYIVKGQSYTCMATGTVYIATKKCATCSVAITAATAATTACVGGSVQLSSTVTGSTGGVFYWKGPGGFVSNVKNPIVPIAIAGPNVFTILYTDSVLLPNNPIYCTASATVSVNGVNCGSRISAVEDYNDAGITLTASPNPTDGRVTIEVRLQKPSMVKLQMTDLLGRPVEQWTSGEEQDHHTFDVSLERYQAGVYVMTAEADKQRATKKIIKGNK